MHYPKRALSLCSLLLALAACGEVVPVDGAQADASPNDNADAMVVVGACEGDSIAIDDLLDCFIAAQCKWQVTCGYFPSTVQDCIATVKSEGDFNLTRTLESVEAGRTIFDGAAAAECLAKIDAASCTESPGEECDTVFVGTIPDGGLCYEENECSGVSANCQQSECQDQCCAGSCQDAALLGGDCSNRSCAQGNACVFTETPNPFNYTCYDGALNSKCSSDYHCDDGLYCKDSGIGGGTCKPAFMENSNCQTNGQCLAPLTCVGESAANSGICRKVDTVGAVCDGNCAGNLFCDEPIDGTPGACAMRRAVNGSCTSNSHCQVQLYCRDSDSTCQVPPGLNMACQNYDCGPGLFCTTELPGSNGNNGVCAQPVINGLPCNDDDHCADGVCANNVCEAYMSCYL